MESPPGSVDPPVSTGINACIPALSLYGFSAAPGPLSPVFLWGFHGRPNDFDPVDDPDRGPWDVMHPGHPCDPCRFDEGESIPPGDLDGPAAINMNRERDAGSPPMGIMPEIENGPVRPVDRAVNQGNDRPSVDVRVGNGHVEIGPV